MAVTKEYVIDNEGRFFRRTVQMDELNATDALANTFASSKVVKVPRAVVIEGCGPVGFSMSPDGAYQYWSVPLNEITFKCPFNAVATSKGNELTPDFSGKGTQLSITWSKADAMMNQAAMPKLIFMVNVYQDKEHSYVNRQYLYMVHKDGNCYRLPLSNLYETCELCNGEYDSMKETSIQSVLAALDQFRNAPWNQDLTGYTNVNDTAKFFRFKPLEKGFQTLPVEATVWTSLCKKVSTAETKYVL